MLWSEFFIPTLKEDPQDAEAVSHKLMIRSGMIRKLTAGAYTYLPLGLRILVKVQAMIREEMEKAGAIELLMPALQPTELWHRTGRYDVIGDVMMKVTDRHSKEVVLGPTHEEVITDLVSREVRSYKDLPLILYQIQNKFRDEVRPRFGVVRSCEFIMKDAYSFDTDIEAMEKSYKNMFDAYCRIFDRCGIPYVPVVADSGVMGGSGSHEFMVPAEIGEDRIIICGQCSYSASSEVASTTANCAPSNDEENLKEKEEVITPGISSVEEVSSFLKVDPRRLLKTMIFISEEGDPFVTLLRGDHEINEVKLSKVVGGEGFRFADDREILELTGAPVGFSGPCGLEGLRIIADGSVKCMINAVAGANKKDRHLLNVNKERDYKVDEYADIRDVTSEDKCPECGGAITIKDAIEIGHTFKLGTKYSGVLGANFLDGDGKQKPIIMGCYGIGVNRILAAMIETGHDENGIIWPMSVSPFKAVIIPVKADDELVVREARSIYENCKKAGMEVLLDDRKKSAGVKFKDADLIGIPLQVVIGSKSLAQGKIELKRRSSGDKELVDRESSVDVIKKILEGEDA